MGSMTGIETRHIKGCASEHGRRCTCNPTYRAIVRRGVKLPALKKSFKDRESARLWKLEIERAKAQGLLVRRVENMSLRVYANDVLGRMERGELYGRGRMPYKTRTIQGYRISLERHVFPRLGGNRLVDIHRRDVQALIEHLLGTNQLNVNTIRNAINPLRVVYRVAVREEIVAVSPCQYLEVPLYRRQERRIATPERVNELLSVLPEGDRPAWLCAVYAGLRRGEIAGLRVCDIDLDNGVIHVRQAWDDHNREMCAPKYYSRRTVPLLPPLRAAILGHIARTGHRGDDLLFDAKLDSLAARAKRLWGSSALTFHEGRHTYASILRAAGLDLKIISTYMGHAQTSTTDDIYVKLFEGHEVASAEKITRWLSNA